MKKLILATIAVFFLVCYIGVQAQTPQTKLDQLKLMQGGVGTWQHVISKDSSEVMECQQYGNAFVQNTYLVVNGKKSLRYGIISLFSPKEDKFKGFWFRPSGSYSTFLSSFVSENKSRSDFVQNFNPEKVLYRTEGVSETPNSYTATFFKLDGTKSGEYKWTKIK